MPPNPRLELRVKQGRARVAKTETPLSEREMLVAGGPFSLLAITYRGAHTTARGAS